MRKIVIFGLALAGLLAWTPALRATVLESPAEGAILSGIGFISGWKCHAGTITVVIDENGEHLSVAMHQERGDLRLVCGGTIRHGFVKQFNWALLGNGEHVVVAYDDGVEFARSTFTVGTTGEEFLTDVKHQTVVDGFPAPGERAVLEWNESTQHFEVVAVWDTALTGTYDRTYWRNYTAAQETGTYATDEELYAELPDLATCFAGRLSQAAKNRALEAANQIRALHGLTPVQYRTAYSQQMQAASLIQAANGYPGHYPDPSARCYTTEGATGSETSNLTGYTTGRLKSRDPAENVVRWTNDAGNRGQVSGVGHRRWVLNPFAASFAYGQVYGYGAHKVLGYDREVGRLIRSEVEFVAFPYEVYPFYLVEGDPPWSFSVIEDPDARWNNRFDYFRDATITVTRVVNGAALPITDRYTDTRGVGVPNILSWRVQDWQYDTLYEVAINGVTMQDGGTRDYVYSVFIDRANLE